MPTKKNKSVTPKLSDLTPAPYNPRKISSDAAKGLSESLKRFGDISGIVWNKNTEHLVCGHQRVKILKSAGAKFDGTGFEFQDKRWPIRIVDIDEDTEKAINVAANNQHISGDWENDKLLDLLSDFQNLPEFENLKFDELAKDMGIGLDANETPGESVPEKSLFEVVVECQTEFDTEETFNKLTEMGFKCRILIL